MILLRWYASYLVLQVFFFVVTGAAKATQEKPSANGTTSLPENITVPSNYSLKVIEGGWLEIVVVRPSHLAFTIEPAAPGNEWLLQENSTYSIAVDIYDKERKINPSPNIAISVKFPPDLFDVIQKSKNGTFHVVRAKKPGKGVISGSLEGPLNEDGTVTKIKPNTILGQQEITVYPELQVSPPMIFLPWDSTVKPVYTLKPVASGATGVYHWESMNPSFAALSYKSGTKNSNSPTILTTGKGSSKIFAFDAQSYIFKKPVIVEISEIEDIETVPGISETFLQESIYIQLAMYGKPQGEPNLRTFDNCTQIPVDVDIVEKNRFKYSSTVEEGVAIHPRACRAIRLTCTSTGPSRVWISYRNPSTGKQINTTTVISCFAPLKVEHPTSDAVIALGTSIEVAFEGGPHKWPEKPSGYFSTLTPSDPKVFHVTPIIDPHRYRRELHVFRVSCRSLGTSELILKVGNENSPTLRQPAVLQQNITLTCDVPIALSVKPRPKSETKCPLNTALFKLPISFSQPSELEVNALDELGRTFYNITSLKIDWSLSDYTVAKISTHRDYTEVVNGAFGYRKWLRNIITLNPVGKEATVIVTAKASSYRSEVLTSERVTDSPYKELTEIKTEASFMLVDKPHIEPKEITLFNHEDNKGVFQLTKGSGYFKLEIDSTSAAAMLTYDQGQRIITAKPLRDGRTKFKVIDACVDSGVGSKEFVEGSVRVVDPTEIRYSALEKVQVGKTADVEVEVLDSTGGVIPSRYHTLMNLQAEVVSSTPTITVNKIDTESTTKSIYRVTAVGLGRAQIVFKTGSVQLKIYHKVIQSNPISIEVFAPISIAPGRINIAVSSQLEIDTTGGPLDSATIEFTSSDVEVATVSPDGLLEALSIGSTVVTIKSVGLTNQVVYTQTQVDVNVIPYKSNRQNKIVPPQVEEELPQIRVLRTPPSPAPPVLPPSSSSSSYESYKLVFTIICLLIAAFFTHHWLQRRQRQSVVDHSMASPSRSFHETHSPQLFTTQSPRTTPAILTKTKSSSFGSQRPFNLSSSQGFAACERNALSGSNSGNSNSSGNSPTLSPTSSPKGVAGKPLWSQTRT